MIECIFVVQICCYSKCGVVLEELNPHLPLAFWLSSPLFSTSLQMWFGLPHPSIACILQCMCTHPIDVTSFHLLCCAHGNERMSTHDVVHDTFVAIAWDANFNVGQEQLHPFFSITFHSFRQRVDVVFTKNGICILIDVVIANLTWVDLFCWSCATRRFIASKVIQAKKRAIAIGTPLIISVWSIWMFKQTSWCVLTWLCQCHVKLQRARGPSYFCLGYFSP
jgi:hypothetical protein